MNMYFIQVKATPTVDAKEYESCGGALIDVIVRASSMEEAEPLALAHITDRAWSIEETLTTLQLLPEHISKMDETEVKTFQMAMLRGIASHFATWPKGKTANGDSVSNDSGSSD